MDEITNEQNIPLSQWPTSEVVKSLNETYHALFDGGGQNSDASVFIEEFIKDYEAELEKRGVGPVYDCGDKNCPYCPDGAIS